MPIGDTGGIHQRCRSVRQSGSQYSPRGGTDLPATIADPAEEQQESVETMLVRLPSNLKEQVKKRANEEERTQAQVIRRALRHYLAEVPASA